MSAYTIVTRVLHFTPFPPRSFHSVTGTDPAHVTTCERYGGQCRCKVKVEGHDCDTCKPDAFSFGASAADGCLACSCDTRGTVDGSATCDATSGQCACKLNVQSLKCTACKTGSFGLNASHVDGCEPCDCYTRGVTLNSTCDPVDGQCQCMNDAGDVSRGGRRCVSVHDVTGVFFVCVCG